MDDFVFTVLPYIYVALSIGIAVAAFTKLPSTTAGLLIGIGSATSALLSIASRVIQATLSGGGFEAIMAISLLSSVLQLFCAVAIVIGVFQIPSSLDELASSMARRTERSNPTSARW